MIGLAEISESGRVGQVVTDGVTYNWWASNCVTGDEDMEFQDWRNTRGVVPTGGYRVIGTIVLGLI